LRQGQAESCEDTRREAAKGTWGQAGALRQFRSSGIGQHTRTPTHTTPQLANDVALHHRLIRASLLLCRSRPPLPLLLLARYAVRHTHRRDHTNTYILRGAIGNLRAQASVAGGRGCFSRLVLHTDKHDNALRITGCESPSVRLAFCCSFTAPARQCSSVSVTVLLVEWRVLLARLASASLDCAVQNYVCRELLIQVRELLTRYYENVCGHAQFMSV